MSIFFISIIASNAFRGGPVRVRRRFQQYAQSELPRRAAAIPAPAAGPFGASVADNGMPVAVGFGLVLGEDLKR
jgi:hypothetical protein